jgi:hypothetical protein
VETVKNEVISKDKFCSHCGYGLIIGSEDASSYLSEMRQFSKDQEEANNLEKLDDLDLNNPTGILKAQLRMLTSIYRRLEKLEGKEKEGLKVKVDDLDIPFWSMVALEFKALLVGLFFISIFTCTGFLIFGGFLKDLFLPLLNNLP